MQTAYPFRAIQSVDQWRRSAHFHTRVDINSGAVSLAPIDTAVGEMSWLEEPVVPCAEVTAPMALDSACRLYRAIPERRQVYRWLWSKERQRPDSEMEPVTLFDERILQPGDFRWRHEPQTVLSRPSALAIDTDDRLFVADQAGDRIHIIDLIENRLLRSVILPRGSAPSALAASGRRIYLLNRLGLFQLTAHSEPRSIELGPEIGNISTLAASSLGLVLLADGGTEQAAVVPALAPEKRFRIPFATVMHFIARDKLVIARGCQEELLVVRLYPLAWQTRPPLLERLRAKGYDGRGLVGTASGRVGYFSARGFRIAHALKPRYATRGRVVTFALDSGAPQNRWGTVHLDACVPAGCEIRVRFVSADQVPEFNRLSHRAPVNDGEFPPLHKPELSPALPDNQVVIDFIEADVAPALPLYRRDSGNELVWSVEPDGGLMTYECPVQAAPGRFIWLVLELTGSGKATPSLARLRVQQRGHELLRHLPALYSREAQAEDFLKRYLAIPDSLLSYFDAAAFFRHALLDPYACPGQLLPWLAAFVGLLLDRRFSESTCRELIAKAIWLFRFRGTVQGLRTFLQIYLRVPVIIIEHFKLRGEGGALVGEDRSQCGQAVVGAGLRVGLTLPEAESVSGGIEKKSARPSQDSRSHRFTVVVAAVLSNEEMAVVNHILAVHRPAHTVFEVCTVEAGMRIGLGMHLQLTTLIGASGGFDKTQLDRSVLGRSSLVGSPGVGGAVGSGRLDYDARLG